jgi:hypothetical protein
VAHARGLHSGADGERGVRREVNISSSGRPDFKILVSQANGDDKVVLTAGVMLAESQTKRLSLAPFGRRAELAIGLGALLHGRSTPFSIEEDQGVVTRITMSRAIYADGFTKDRLMTSVNELFASAALVLINLGDFFASLESVQKDDRTVVAQAPTTPPNPQLRTTCPRCGGVVSPQQKFCIKCGATLLPSAAGTESARK